MKLAQWLTETQTRQGDLAETVGLTQSRISQIAKDGTGSLATALKIEAATGGAVTIAELLFEARPNGSHSAEPAPAPQPERAI